MASSFTRTARRTGRFLLVPVLVLLAFAPGCSRQGPSDFERQKMAKQEAADYLQARGGKVTTKLFGDSEPGKQLSGYAVVLSGVQDIDDAVFQRLKLLHPLGELDLSKSNVTDAHLERINDKEIGTWLTTLNLGHTAVTDQGLDKLTNLHMLSTLILTGTRATPAADEPLRQRLRVQQRAADPMMPNSLKQLTIQR